MEKLSARIRNAAGEAAQGKEKFGDLIGKLRGVRINLRNLANEVEKLEGLPRDEVAVRIDAARAAVRKLHSRFPGDPDVVDALNAFTSVLAISPIMKSVPIQRTDEINCELVMPAQPLFDEIERLRAHIEKLKKGEKMSERSEEHVQLLIDLRQLDVLADRLSAVMYALFLSTEKLHDVTGNTNLVKNFNDERNALIDIHQALHDLAVKAKQ